VKFLLIVGIIAGAAWYHFKPLPPGKGPAADGGKRAATVILRTIENYRGARGYYPGSLEDLVPEFLAGIPTLSNGSRFEYLRLGMNYKLTFNYESPLPVHCSYMPTTQWSCEWF